MLEQKLILKKLTVCFKRFISTSFVWTLNTAWIPYVNKKENSANIITTCQLCFPRSFSLFPQKMYCWNQLMHYNERTKPKASYVERIYFEFAERETSVIWVVENSIINLCHLPLSVCYDITVDILYLASASKYHGMVLSRDENNFIKQY